MATSPYNLNSNAPHQVPVVNGRTSRATYCITIPNAAPVSANYVVCSINAGPQAYTKVRRIILWNPGQYTAAQKTIVDMVRCTAASSGGSLYTPQAYDTQYDAAFSGIVRTAGPGITTAGTSVVILSAFAPAAVGNYVPTILDFSGEMGMKPPIIPPGVLNGLAFRVTTGAAGGANFDMSIEISEEEI